MVYYPSDSHFHQSINRNTSSDSRKSGGVFVPQETTSGLSGKAKKKYSKKILSIRYVFLVFMALLVIFGGYVLYSTSATMDRVTGDKNSLIKGVVKMLPLGGSLFQILPLEDDKQEVSPMEQVKAGNLKRLNFLLLGIRGVGDPNGGLLTDTMMVVSVDLSHNKIALISIPRDLYVEIPYINQRGKINEAYAVGNYKGGDFKAGLDASKQVVEEVVGLDIHYAASLDFKAFKEIVDTLGGVTIYLDKPFVEKYQFEEGSIELPRGTNVINGDKALLFVRSRFSTSDFDRAKRQQQILLSVKDKAFSLGVISNPVKLMAILNTLGNHVRTDAEFWEIQELFNIFSKIKIQDVKQRVFDTSANGMLYQTHSDSGAYILLPEGGNFKKIHQVCNDIFD